MSIIIPAILPTSRADLDKKLAQLIGITTEVQVDIVDGRFVSPPSWPYSERETQEAVRPLTEHAFAHAGGMHMEMDLMVEHPEKEIERWVKAGANRITVHAESAHQLPHLITFLRNTYGHEKDFAPDLLSFGLSINVGTDTSLIEPYLEDCEYVQFMGIRTIGKQGQPFERGVLAKIAAFKKKYPSMPIQVDGGVSLHTAPDLLSAGVSRLIVGSALWNAPDLSVAFDAFTKLTEEYGLYT